MKRSFKIYAVSTASEKHFPENSLVKFSHYLPSPITLDGQWKVAVAGVGLHLNINTIQSKEDQADIFLVSAFRGMEDLSRSPDRYGEDALTLTSGEYEPESLAHAIEEFFRRNEKTRRMSCRVNDSSQFVIRNPTTTPVYFLIHQHLFEALRLKPEHGFIWWHNAKYFKLRVSRGDSVTGQKVQHLYYPEKYNIHCSLAKAQNLGREQETAIYTGFLPLSAKNTFYYHNVRTLRFYPLATDTLNRIDIEITGSDGELLRLASGQPTIVELYFSKMESRQTFITCTNSDEQKASQFVTRLSHPLDVNHHEMALYSLIIPNSIRNLKTELCRKPIGFILEHYHDDLQDDEDDKSRHFANNDGDELNHNDIETQINHNDIQTQLHSRRRRRKIKRAENLRLIYLVPGFYDSLETLCEAMNVNLPSAMRFSAKSGHLNVELNDPTQGLWLFFPNELSSLLGFDENKHHGQYHMTVRVDPGDEEMSKSLPKVANLYKAYPSYVTVYTSNIEPQIFGEGYYQILRISPLNAHAKGSVIYCDYAHLEFINIKTDFLDKIYIYLRDASGDFLEFEDEKAEVIANVVIRPIKKSLL